MNIFLVLFNMFLAFMVLGVFDISFTNYLKNSKLNLHDKIGFISIALIVPILSGIKSALMM